jgi:hypothetical protein
MGFEGDAVQLSAIPALTPADEPRIDNKFVARALVLGLPVQGARGLTATLGINNELLGTVLRQGLSTIEVEFLEHGTEEDKANLHYVLHSKACENIPAHVQRDVARGWYHGGPFLAGDFDTGHEGMNLDAFMQHRHSQIAQLEKPHVLALRLYTTSSFRSINDPLRAGIVPHPFRMTVYYLSEGLRRLRAVSAALEPQTFTQTVWLWRGMRDMKISKGFMDTGGSELAAMSTSRTMQTALRYAASTCPLIFKYRTQGLSRGCSIKYLSAYPDEDEYLYPPLTYLLPEAIEVKEGVTFVEVAPQM